jgi:hypothetical protein
MKLVSTLFLLMALFSSTVLAEGNQGSGGFTYDGGATVTVKGGITTEDGDPPPACTPTAEDDCDGNQGSGGRSAMMVFIQKYVISFFD